MILTMEKLQIAYQAIDLLKSIDMPISAEQKNILAHMEREYLRDEVIPLLEQEMLPMVEKMVNSFDLEISYDGENGLDISVVDQPVVQPTIFDDDSPRSRQKRYILKVTFPDGHVSCHRIVWKTMNDVIRYAGPLSGIDYMTVTKLDVLDDFDEIKLCVAYKIGGEIINEIPASLKILAQVEPVYETFAGWKCDTSKIRRYEDLPANAKIYLERLAEVTKIKLGIISVGPNRDQTIVVEENIF